MSKENLQVTDLSRLKLTDGLIRVSEVLSYLDGDCFFTRNEAARYLRISVRRLDQCKVPRYRLPGDKGHGRVLFRKSELESLLIREQPKQTELTNGLNAIDTDRRLDLDRMADQFRSKFLAKGKEK